VWLASCLLPERASRLGCARRRNGPGLAGGGVGAGTFGVRAGLWAGAKSWTQPAVDVVVVVALLFVFLACRRAFVSWCLRSAVAVALDVFSFMRSLQLACIPTVWCSESCDGGCLGALLFAWCSLLLLRSARCVAAPLAICNTRYHTHTHKVVAMLVFIEDAVVFVVGGFFVVVSVGGHA
jgi:hypothetical protein